MTLDEALEHDILQVMRPGGRYLNVDEVTARVAPLREPDVRRVLIALHKRGYLELDHAGGGKVASYQRKAVRRI